MSINVKVLIIPGFGMVGTFGLSGASSLFDHVSAPLPESARLFRVLEWSGFRVKRSKLAPGTRFGTTARKMVIIPGFGMVGAFGLSGVN